MPSYTATTTLKRVQYDPAEDGSVIATSFFETALINDDDPTDVSVRPWESVTHPIPDELAGQIADLATAALGVKTEAKAVEKAARVLESKARVVVKG